MLGFNIPRKAMNWALALVHPRRRLIALMVTLSLLNVIVGIVFSITYLSDLAGLPPRLYLQKYAYEIWLPGCSFACCGAMPLFYTIIPAARLSLIRPRVDKRVDGELRALGLKGQAYSKTSMLYRGTIADRRVSVFIDARRPTGGVYMTPKPMSVTFNPTIHIQIGASHRGDMSILPEETQIENVAEEVIKMPANRKLLPGKTMLTLDSQWSYKLLTAAEVAPAIRRLAPEGDPNRHNNLSIGAYAVTLKTQFMNVPVTSEPLVEFVTADHMQQILADLQIVAEAAESLPEPAHPGPDDLLTRVTAIDPIALQKLPQAAILIIFSAFWCGVMILSILR